MKYVVLIVIATFVWGCSRPPSRPIVNPEAIHRSTEQWFESRGLAEVGCGFRLVRDPHGIQLVAVEIYRLQEHPMQDEFVKFLRQEESIPEDCNPFVRFFDKRDTFESGELPVAPDGTVNTDGANWKQSSSRSLLREQKLRTK